MKQPDKSPRSMSELDPRETPWLTIEEAGSYLGLSRDGAYRAARDGYLPTLKVAKRKSVVPTVALMRLLELDEREP